MMKKIFKALAGKRLRTIGLLTFLSAIASGSPVCANSLSESDSINVLHYNITIDTLGKASSLLQAHATVTFVPVVNNISSFTLDLLGLTVDSVEDSGSQLTFTHNDTLLRIYLSSAAGTSDTISVTIWYGGIPEKDVSGFGGFYFSAGYAFNIGVAFTADPHAYGRVWFPCKDNFTDKSTYDFYIRTVDPDVAVCGGELVSETPNGDGTTSWHWQLTDPINTYLASAAVADYVAVKDTFLSVSGGGIPTAVYVKQTDSLDATGTFQNLNACLQAFEFWFGPFAWQRAGYVGVPFNSGAMEHATNIAFPVAAINGTTSFEDLMSHELSHNWFGNYVTCSEAGEMWLNEGWASYCEAIFREWMYGKDSYKNYIRSMHNDVLRKTYIDEGGYLAVSGLDHDHTYGSTVYEKGALVAHTLRGYLGDSMFRTGMQQYMADFAFANANSDTLKNSLEQTSGIQLDDFFAGWAYSPGFPHFQVDSFLSAPNGGMFDVQVHLRRRYLGTAGTFDGNLIELRFVDQQLNAVDSIFEFSGNVQVINFQLPIDPVLVFADPEEKISDATTDNYEVIDSAGDYTFFNTYFVLHLQNITDTMLLRVTHNWVAPDSFKQQKNGVRLSDSRYWKVESNWPSGTFGSADITYSGIISSSNSLGYLDHTWLTNGEDSIVLFFREGPGEEWTEVDSYTVVTGSLIDKKGTVTIDSLKPGEYCLGTIDASVISREEKREHETVIMYPNPARDELKVELRKGKIHRIGVLDVAGELLDLQEFSGENREEIIKTDHFPGGTYIVEIQDKSGNQIQLRLILVK